jgi:hypothetical protein
MPAKQPPRVDDPGYWRFRAANTRGLAKESTDETSKTLLAKISEAYDALAQNAERCVAGADRPDARSGLTPNKKTAVYVETTRYAATRCV